MAVLKDLTTKQETLEQKVARLEAENASLKSGVLKTTVTPTDYKGTPTLEFKGNFKPFFAGASKCRAHLEMAAEIQAWLKSLPAKK